MKKINQEIEKTFNEIEVIIGALYAEATDHTND